VALSLCQLPLTHLLAALWLWVEVPAPQCGHMSMIQASGSGEERAWTPIHPFYELPMADKISSSLSDTINSFFLQGTLSTVSCSTATFVKRYRATSHLQG